MRFRGSHLGRTMLRAAIAAMGATGVIGLATLAHAEDRTLSMYMIHTKETINVTYKRDGVWDEEGLEEINHFMRDWRVDESIKMDRELIDLIWTLHTRLGSQEPIHLISAYRSKRTNDRLRRAGGGQARRSQHTLGKAADIHFPDVPVKKLRASALIQEIGGVGYYPRSGIPFVHVDVGNVRTWPRMPRLELAALFPEGKTAYVPSDGRRITKKDYERAEAKGMVDHVLIAQAQGIAPTMVASLTPPPTPNPVRAIAQLSEPPATMPVVATAADTEFKPMALAPANAEIPEPEKPSDRYALASLGGSLAWARETLRPTRTAAPSQPQGSPQVEALASPEARTPAYQEAKPVNAPAFDEEHPDELTYVPVETAKLMSIPSIAHDREIATLSAPEQGNVDYMFRDMDGPAHFTLRPTSDYLGLASIQTLTGPAVPGVYASARKKGPVQLASAN